MRRDTAHFNIVSKEIDMIFFFMILEFNIIIIIE